jgi:hypothetical protein
MSKEAKPIAVVYIIPPEWLADPLYKYEQALQERWPDYHVLVVPADERIQQRTIELEVFYDKDFTDTNYDDLKKWITDYITPAIENKP